jgi:hypothetical protein
MPMDKQEKLQNPEIICSARCTSNHGLHWLHLPSSRAHPLPDCQLNNKHNRIVFHTYAIENSVEPNVARKAPLKHTNSPLRPWTERKATEKSSQSWDTENDKAIPSFLSLLRHHFALPHIIAMDPIAVQLCCNWVGCNSTALYTLIVWCSSPRVATHFSKTPSAEFRV